MSVTNLGLQCVCIMQQEGNSEFEKTIKNANNLNAVCEATKQLYKMKSALSTPSAASDQHNKSSLIERGTLFYSKVLVMMRCRLSGKLFTW